MSYHCTVCLHEQSDWGKLCSILLKQTSLGPCIHLHVQPRIFVPSEPKIHLPFYREGPCIHSRESISSKPFSP
ncbi:ORF1184 [White spot syndrome virus]|uniref:Wsv102 n=3 Tax=White spot syndrome virus TaxID=342409 RepID=Q8VB81_WSSVS|nr:wsv102 [Shrimp white spot syndrome virus]AFX59479.1 wsv102 [White spot syndrome virus]AAL33106.1 wsv102 [Shrimp white spot syndrome virus]AAL89026.1 WSSV158 [Shrimp white spot syndrome virus]ATU83961.1 ORF1184 [White spot syndrome virus]AWQ60290.1 wsv102 [Shrimp white spot syndrome virus]